MSRLVLEPTSTAQWKALVSEAAANCDCCLEEELESYLVFLLMRFTARPELANRVLALEYLQSMTATGSLQVEQLRDVGDQCLLYSGLYPHQASRRLVRVSYFVALGRSAYSHLAERLRHTSAEIYTGLSDAFVGLMDVLNAMRECGSEPAMDLVEAAELWQDTRSQRALKLIQEATDGELVWHSGDENSH